MYRIRAAWYREEKDNGMMQKVVEWGREESKEDKCQAVK